MRLIMMCRFRAANKHHSLFFLKQTYNEEFTLLLVQVLLDMSEASHLFRLLKYSFYRKHRDRTWLLQSVGKYYQEFFEFLPEIMNSLFSNMVNVYCTCFLKIKTLTF